MFWLAYSPPRPIPFNKNTNKPLWSECELLLQILANMACALLFLLAKLLQLTIFGALRESEIKVFKPPSPLLTSN